MDSGGGVGKRQSCRRDEGMGAQGPTDLRATWKIPLFPLGMVVLLD